MTLSAKLRRAPTRIVTGAFMLDQGVSKLSGDDDTAKSLHGMASSAYPLLEKVDSKLLMRTLGVTETALGAALLLPMVPAGLAGLGLAAFSGGLLGLYWRTPGMHNDGSPRPTKQGIAAAKDAWMFGIGTSLVLDALLTAAHDKRVQKTHELKEAGAAKAAKAGAAAKAARTVTAAKAHEATSAAKAATLAKTAKAAALTTVVKDASKKAMEHVGH